jgi:hypothetical protein
VKWKDLKESDYLEMVYYGHEPPFHAKVVDMDDNAITFMFLNVPGRSILKYLWYQEKLFHSTTKLDIEDDLQFRLMYDKCQ